jgi:hypothetical protein
MLIQPRPQQQNPPNPKQKPMNNLKMCSKGILVAACSAAGQMLSDALRSGLKRFIGMASTA